MRARRPGTDTEFRDRRAAEKKKPPPPKKNVIQLSIDIGIFQIINLSLSGKEENESYVCLYMCTGKVGH